MEMFPFSSHLSPTPWSSSPEKRRYYAPFTPSPLNPNTHLDTPRQAKSTSKPKPTTAPSQSRPKRKSHRPPKPAHRTARYASPTQLLLRQKAAAAWRSETLRHHVLSPGQAQPQTQLYQEEWEAAPWSLNSPSQGRREWEYNFNTNGTDKRKQHDWAAAATITTSTTTTTTTTTTGDAILTIPIPDELLLQDKGGEEDENEEDDGDIGLLVWPADKRPAAAAAAAAADDDDDDDGNQDFRTVDFATLFPSPPAMASASASPRSAAVTVVPGERSLRLPVRATVQWQRRHGFSRTDVTMRRVLFVMGLLIGLGLVHGLVRTFGTRPLAVGT
ncbi:hypothetical protein MFIFM68171_06935 [Madurella fahalii]|uniref:Uncharacterized protein n=1 Tax=Madurella fahalii TaxID=1157608 RepID=A0ABQ0GGM7_9PEZI